jgi:hypothetical protein
MARNSPPLTRHAGTAIEAETIAIVCEGQKTEGIYFNGIRTKFRLATTRINVVGLGADPMTVVEKAEQLKPDYDHAWAVFDVEAAGPHSRRHPSLEAAVAKADQVGIRYAISHPCFELWLILHFGLHTAYLSNRDARKMVSGLDCGYDDKYFDFSKVWPLHQSALTNADQLDRQKRVDYPSLVDRNPWTTTHELVRQLLSMAGGNASETANSDQRQEAAGRERPARARARRHSGR